MQDDRPYKSNPFGKDEVSVKITDNWAGMDNILSSGIFTTKEKRVITSSAVDPVVDLLRKSAPHMEKKHSMKLYGYARDHLQNEVIHSPAKGKDAWKGTTLVGWSSRVYPIAAWTNYGTFRQKPQFWWEHKVVPGLKDVSKDVFAIERATAHAILSKKGMG